MMEACFEYDDVLRRGGHFTGGEALGPANSAVSLQVKNGAVEVTDGPFAETKEVLGGILLLEARDLNHAISLMSRHPGVANGPFEIRPADEAINQLIAARNEAVAKEGRPDDEAEIRGLLEEWAANIRADRKDKILSRHASDLLIYDVLAPLKYESAEAYRESWDEWQPEHVGETVFELVDLKISASDTVGFASALIRCGGARPDGSVDDDTARATFCLEKRAGAWLVVHQHVSMPLPND